MTDNSITEALLLLAKSKQYDLDILIEQQQKELSNFRIEIGNIKKKAQDNCIHPSTREEKDYNYHTRETYYEKYCTICNKLLSRV